MATIPYWRLNSLKNFIPFYNHPISKFCLEVSDMVAVQLKLKKSQALFFPILSLVYIYMSMFLGHAKNIARDIFRDCLQILLKRM